VSTGRDRGDGGEEDCEAREQRGVKVETYIDHLRKEIDWYSHKEKAAPDKSKQVDARIARLRDAHEDHTDAFARRVESLRVEAENYKNKIPQPQRRRETYGVFGGVDTVFDPDGSSSSAIQARCPPPLPPSAPPPSLLVPF